MNKYEWLATLSPVELAEYLGKIACPPGDEPISCQKNNDCTECWLMVLLTTQEED